MSDVAPPATGVWYDLDETTSQVLAILRLTEQDVDLERIRDCVPAAALRIEQYVDAAEDPVAGPPPSQQLQQALNKATIDLYVRPGPSIDGSVDVLAPIRSELGPSKQRWGVA